MIIGDIQLPTMVFFVIIVIISMAGHILAHVSQFLRTDYSSDYSWVDNPSGEYSNDKNLDYLLFCGSCYSTAITEDARYPINANYAGIFQDTRDHISSYPNTISSRLSEDYRHLRIIIRTFIVRDLVSYAATVHLNGMGQTGIEEDFSHTILNG